MEEEVILKIIEKSNNKGIKLQNIEKNLNLDNRENLLKVLNNLEMNGKIFLTENDKYIIFPEGLEIGQILCSHKGNRYIRHNDIQFYIDPNDMNCALDFDTVVFKPDFDHKTATIERVLKRESNQIVCELHSCGKKKQLSSYNTPSKIDVIIDEDKLNDFVDGDRFVVEIDNLSFLNSTKGKIIEKLGNKNDPDIEEISIANSKGFSTNYSSKYLEEIKAIPSEVKEEEILNRLDLRDEEIFTIDSKYTKDMDDALSLKILPNGNFLLGVHIANVSHYVKRNSEIFNDAINRGTSVYMANSVIPMLHFVLSNGICSLNPEVDRLTKSCIMEITPKGKVINYEIKDSVINSKKKMTYEEVNMILEDGIIPSGYEPYIETLLNLHKLTSILSKNREKEGYIEFASSEIKVITDSANNPIEFRKVHQGPAEKMVEYSMVLANEVVASHIYWMDLPFVYRIHGAPDQYKIEDTMDLLHELGYRLDMLNNISSPHLLQQVLKQLSVREEYQALSSLFLRTMSKAKYSVDNIGHFALGLDCYTHFTSPIRRAPDLLVHTLLDMYEESNINNIDFEKLEEKLKEHCNHASYKERQADIAEMEVNKLRMVQYMENHIGDTFMGRILEIYPNEVNIITEDNIYAVVPIEYIAGNNIRYNSSSKSLRGSNASYYIGNKVESQVLAVSKEDRKVICSIEKNLSIKNKPKVKTLKLH